MIPVAVKDPLRRRFGNRVRFDEPMSRHTRFQVGGPVDAWVKVETEEELAFILPLVHENGLPVLLLGGGTNLLVKDQGIRGVAICLAGDLKAIAPHGETGFSAFGGAVLSRLCRHAVEKGLAGLNFAVGIPGTVGGAIRMNAGTAGGDMAGAIQAIRLMGPDGSSKWFAREQLRFAYRRLSLAEGERWRLADCAILEGRFSLTQGDVKALAEERKRLLYWRKTTQPTRLPSAGCFFRNPEGGQPAGKLIDLAGLKGLRVGGAEVSPVHANYLVNRGGATAADILQLMAIVRERVFQNFNLILEPEVHIVGNS